MEDEEWCAMDDRARSQMCSLYFFSDFFRSFEDGGTFYIYALLDMY